MLKEFYDDPERARRMVVFCSTGGVNYFGWVARGQAVVAAFVEPQDTPTCSG